MNDSETTRFLTAIANDPGVASALFLAVGDRQGDAAFRAIDPSLNLFKGW